MYSLVTVHKLTRKNVPLIWVLYSQVVHCKFHPPAATRLSIKAQEILFITIIAVAYDKISL